MDPEAYTVIGQPNKCVGRQRMPGVRLFRNFRLEAVSCQISNYIAYYNSLRELRTNLEDYL